VPQDGRFRVRYKGRLIDFRVSIMPTIHGENAVLRVLDKESMSEKFKQPDAGRGGLCRRRPEAFRRYIREPYGMVLVTGPTGSGKTTTLYAALNEIKSDEDKIITIEDPVEYQIRGITQIPVNEKKGLTFARGLRSILRHDPDKILVGEIRDQETAQIAINSALTGHLVFTTVHANNVVDVLGRFLNMGVEAYNFVSALNCILAQRLVRTICEYCAQDGALRRRDAAGQRHGPGRVARLRLPRGRGLHGVRRHRLSRPDGDPRAAGFDRPDPRMILEKKPTSEVRKLAQKEGMSFLRESALERVRRGLTTLKEINKVTFIEASRDSMEGVLAANLVPAPSPPPSPAARICLLYRTLDLPEEPAARRRDSARHRRGRRVF
jgi:type II secretory ATPase GspE/PulE/Tfp pilus assembly ATPase PilB-like protein